MKRYGALGLLLASLAGLAAIMFGTSPEQAPPYVSILIFLLLYGAVSALLYFVLRLVRFLGVFHWSSHRMWRYAFMGAVVPVIVLLLQSIGQLTPRDIVLLIIFFGAIVLYLRRSRARTTQQKD